MNASAPSSHGAESSGRSLSAAPRSWTKLRSPPARQGRRSGRSAPRRPAPPGPAPGRRRRPRRARPIASRPPRTRGCSAPEPAEPARGRRRAAALAQADPAGHVGAALEIPALGRGRRRPPGRRRPRSPGPAGRSDGARRGSRAPGRGETRHQRESSEAVRVVPRAAARQAVLPRPAYPPTPLFAPLRARSRVTG